MREFRSLLEVALNEFDDESRVVGNAKFGVYAFYDYDGEPIYVGQTNERLRTRIGRHLTNQRTDAVAMRVLDIFEVAELEMWPLWELEGKAKEVAQSRLDQVEYSAYVKAIKDSRFRAILNEKIPPVSPVVELPESFRLPLVVDEPLDERRHPDVRIARRAETISRLAAVARERGEVSDGLRRVLVIQAVRLTYLSASRFAEASGELMPDPSAIDVAALVGTLLAEEPDALTEEDVEHLELEG
ncbi:MAG TPA: GIY-YIG nuclease family protein [Solirubrobacterales bacterium]